MTADTSLVRLCEPIPVAGSVVYDVSMHIVLQLWEIMQKRRCTEPETQVSAEKDLR